MTTKTPGGEASPARSTTAHDRKQLAGALGWTVVQVDKAVILGVLPPYDLKTPGWKAATAGDLAARREELAAALDDGALLTEDEMMTRPGLERGRLAARPRPRRRSRSRPRRVLDPGGRRRPRRPRRRTARPDPPQPLGARRCAELLAELTGLDVTEADLLSLAKQGHAGVADYYKDWALYDVAAVRRLGTTGDGTAIVAAVVAARQAWLAASITTEDAARWLAWDPRALERVATEQGIGQGRFRRWARTDIARLAGDEELAERVRREQLVGPPTRPRSFLTCAAWTSTTAWRHAGSPPAATRRGGPRRLA